MKINIADTHMPKSSDTSIHSPAYMDATSKVIREALKKGMDILQLENGDVVTTTTKVIVTHYIWDERKSGLRKLTEPERKKRKAAIDIARAEQLPIVNFGSTSRLADRPVARTKRKPGRPATPKK